MKRVKLNEVQLSRKSIKRVLNLFPPLLFNRIAIQEISEDFMQLQVRVKYSWMNKNFHRTIFGGTIFSAVDPYFPTMYWHIFSRKKLPMEVWLKSAEIKYKRPATSDLHLHFKLEEEDIQNAIKGLRKNGKHEVWHSVEAIDKYGTVCAEAKTLVYLRNHKNLNLNAF